MNIWQKIAQEKNPFFVLAPMDDVTDTSFRQLLAKTAPPDLFYTEFANVDGLQSAGRKNVLQKLKFSESEHPLIAQIWGLNPDNFLKSTEEIVAMGFDGVDLNMGCPVPGVTKKGACSALIKTPELAGEIIRATQAGAAGKIPVSVKTRIGFNRVQTEEWSSFLLGHNLDALIMHGRTSKEMSKVNCHWDEIGKLPALRDEISPRTIIVGNGDVLNVKQGATLAKEHKVDGIMIGRGVFQDPAVFGGTDQTLSTTEKINLFLRHIELFEQEWGDTKNPNVLKKFAKTYLREFDEASELRSEFMAENRYQGMYSILTKFNNNL